MQLTLDNSNLQGKSNAGPPRELAGPGAKLFLGPYLWRHRNHSIWSKPTHVKSFQFWGPLWVGDPGQFAPAAPHSRRPWSNVVRVIGRWHQIGGNRGIKLCFVHMLRYCSNRVRFGQVHLRERVQTTQYFANKTTKDALIPRHERTWHKGQQLDTSI